MNTHKSVELCDLDLARVSAGADRKPPRGDDTLKQLEPKNTGVVGPRSKPAKPQ